LATQHDTEDERLLQRALDFIESMEVSLRLLQTYLYEDTRPSGDSDLRRERVFIRQKVEAQYDLANELAEAMYRWSQSPRRLD
jgi:hypothetical protein